MSVDSTDIRELGFSLPFLIIVFYFIIIGVIKLLIFRAPEEKELITALEIIAYGSVFVVCAFIYISSFRDRVKNNQYSSGYCHKWVLGKRIKNLLICPSILAVIVIAGCIAYGLFVKYDPKLLYIAILVPLILLIKGVLSHLWLGICLVLIGVGILHSDSIPFVPKIIELLAGEASKLVDYVVTSISGIMAILNFEFNS
jgi:hypothetical protein